MQHNSALSTYTGFTLMTAISVVSHALLTRFQFYPAMLFLVNSKTAIVVLSNLLLLSSFLFGKLTTKLFFGTLRDAEIEEVWAQSRITVTESLFALTIFREELGSWIAPAFAFLLFAKVFHWIVDSRVEFLGQIQDMSRTTQLRIFCILVILSIIDGLIAFSIFKICIRDGPSVVLAFGFEFLILLVNICFTMLRYLLTMVEFHIIQGNWHRRTTIELYFKVLIDTAVFVSYVSFAGIVFAYYGVPLHLLRELYISAKNLYERVLHVYRYQVVMSHLHNRFQNATQEQLDATDKICIICREEMEAGTFVAAPKVLDCGHIFHCQCLQTWLNTRLTCPTCRADIEAQPRGNDELQRDAAARANAGQAGVGGAAAAAVADNESDTASEDDEEEIAAVPPLDRIPLEQGIPAPTVGSQQQPAIFVPETNAQQQVAFAALLGQNVSLSPTAIMRSSSFAPESSARLVEDDLELLNLQLRVFHAQTVAAQATQEAAMAALNLHQLAPSANLD